MARIESSAIDAHDIGIATVLKSTWLVVPPNQREYSWEDEHIKTLFEDLAQAIDKNEGTYFLGSIVLTPGEGLNTWEVADGQQRLATVSILLAAIRNFHKEDSETLLVQYVERLLFEIDPDTRTTVPKLTLNLSDRDFFAKEISGTIDTQPVPNTPKSLHRIRRASELAKERVQTIVAGHKGEHKANALTKWVTYLEHYAKIVVIKVPDQNMAFVMFETLNDRGLRVSQSDLIKNYLYSTSQKQMPEVQDHWTVMVGVLNSSGDDSVLQYVWRATVCLYGHTRERDLLMRIKDKVRGQHSVVTFAGTLADMANDYVALLNPSDKKWNAYPKSIRRHIITLNILRIVVLHPLMLAVARKFEEREANRAFEQFVSWSVRFLICGGGRSGVVEECYAKAAKKIMDGEITDTCDLEKEAINILPSDSLFRANFSTKVIPIERLARYYLRAIEAHIINDDLWVPNDDSDIVNLEHIIPKNPGAEWPELTIEDASELQYRLGNVVLLHAISNSDLGNKGWNDKKPILRECSYLTTKMVAEYDKWGEKSVNDRQARLADHAIKVWPLIVDPIQLGRKARVKRKTI